jgi:cytochrome c oxidase subunit 2
MKKTFAFIITLFLLNPLSVMAQDGYGGSWQLNLQTLVSPMLNEIYDFHTLLLWITGAITVIVTALLLYSSFKYRRKKGVEPATFAHNTFIEVIWTIVPVVILIVIAIPSFKLLYFEDRIPDPELTIKTTGYQWYWGYEYMDYDGLEFLSYPIPDDEIDESKGQRRLLSTDTAVVVPVDTNIQLLVTAADVLHAFALPAAGVKKDAVPGQLNETWMRIDKPGVYFGKCSEICGTGHSYMPIEVHAVSKEEFDVWTKSQGAKLKPKAITEEKEI